MRKRLFLLGLGALVLCAFYLFSREVKRGFLKQTDFNTTVRLQNKIPARFDEIWEDIAFPMTPVSSVALVGLLTTVAFVDWKKKRIRLSALVIPILFGLLIAGEIYGKSVVHHPAPPFFMIKNPTTIFPTYYINEQFSYPSGHTARAVFLGFVIYSLILIPNSLFKSQKLKILGTIGIIAYTSMVAIGRIYLGHHWMSDILGGALLGGGFGLLTAGFISPIITK
jgi:membrane-associated phospholipid phosphatase